MYDEILDQLDMAAKRYPIKHLAPKIKGHVTPVVAESTLRNELNQQPGYKLGLHTAIQIMHHTGDLSALDTIESYFGRVAFVLPKHNGDPRPVMVLAATLAREFADTIRRLGEALEDGNIDAKEKAHIAQAAHALIVSCVELESYLKTEVAK
jgi:hypothetical protein